MDILTLKVFLEVDMDTLMGVHMGILTLDCAKKKTSNFSIDAINIQEGGNERSVKFSEAFSLFAT